MDHDMVHNMTGFRMFPGESEPSLKLTDLIYRRIFFDGNFLSKIFKERGLLSKKCADLFHSTTSVVFCSKFLGR